MSTDDVTSNEASRSMLAIRRRRWFSVVVALIALIALFASALVVFGAAAGARDSHPELARVAHFHRVTP